MIYGNGGLGIDMADDGVTNNPPGGPNDLQNYPVLNSARLTGGEIHPSSPRLSRHPDLIL
jgi:hypothetical protein